MVSTLVTETDMTALLRPDRTGTTATAVRRELSTAGAQDVRVEFTVIESACEPDNALVAEYLQRFESPPVSEQVHRLNVTAQWVHGQVDTKVVTRQVAGCLPPAPDGSPGLWFGQTSTLRSSE